MKNVQNFIARLETGAIVAQYTRPEGSNTNCSIYLEFNEKDRTFSCYSDTEKNLTLNLAENFAENNCFDPFSCGIFYTEVFQQFVPEN